MHHSVIKLWIVLIGYFPIGIRSQGVSPLADQVKAFNQALISEDYKILKKCLDKNIMYTHSNGWSETKQEMIQNLKTNVLVYHSISMDSFHQESSYDTVAVRFYSTVSVTLREKPIQLRLQVFQTWKKNWGKYKMIRRKSIKVG